MASMMRLGVLMGLSGALGGCLRPVTVAYRVADHGEELARKVCDEISATSSALVVGQGRLRCEVTAEVKVEIRVSGDLVVVEVPSHRMHSEIALRVGRASAEMGIREVEVVEYQ